MHELNKIKFNPWPSGGPGGGGGSGGTSSQEKKERELKKVKTSIARAQNKESQSTTNGYTQNTKLQQRRQQELNAQSVNIEKELDKINPNWENEPNWKSKQQDIDYTRDDYTSAKADKDRLAVLRKFNDELKENIKLRKELNKIDQFNSPVEYNKKKNEIVQSDTRKTLAAQDALKNGFNIRSAAQEHSEQLKTINEEVKNKLFERYTQKLKKD